VCFECATSLARATRSGRRPGIDFRRDRGDADESRVEFLVDHERGGEGMSVNDWSSTDIAKEEPEI